MTRIACLGWGSLIWDQQDLPVTGEWSPDGPTLPVEFLRRSENGRVTLVLDPDGTPVPSLWVLLNSPDVASAVDALMEREGVYPSKVATDIGRWTGGAPPSLIPDLAEWASKQKLDGVVWTALSFASKSMPDRQTADQVVDYLRSLSGEKRNLAETYIRRAPEQIATRYRIRIESELGWTRTSDRA